MDRTVLLECIKPQQQRRGELRRTEHTRVFSQHRQLIIHHKNMSDHFWSLFNEDPEVYQGAIEAISEKCQQQDSSQALTIIIEENAKKFYEQFAIDQSLQLKLQLLINITSVESLILDMRWLLPMVQSILTNRLTLENVKIASNLIWLQANLLLNKVYSRSAAPWAVANAWVPKTYQLLALHPSVRTYVGWCISACLRNQTIFKAVFAQSMDQLQRACSLASCLLATERNDDGLLHAYRILDQLTSYNNCFFKRIGPQELCSMIYHIEQLDKEYFNIKIFALRILAFYIIQSQTALDRFLRSDGLRVIINYLSETVYINCTKFALNILYNCVEVFGWRSDVKFQMASSTFLENSIRIIALNGPYVCIDLIQIFTKLIEIEDEGFVECLFQTKMVELFAKRAQDSKQNTQIQAIDQLFQSIAQRTRNKESMFRKLQEIRFGRRL